MTLISEAELILLLKKTEVVAKKSFEDLPKLQYLGIAITNRKSIHEEIQSRLHSKNCED
jgi:hypothetical protein